jgi:hypothetical protein
MNLKACTNLGLTSSAKTNFVVQTAEDPNAQLRRNDALSFP